MSSRIRNWRSFNLRNNNSRYWNWRKPPQETLSLKIKSFTYFESIALNLEFIILYPIFIGGNIWYRNEMSNVFSHFAVCMQYCVTPYHVDILWSKAKATSFFVVRAVGKIISGRLVGKMMMMMMMMMMMIIIIISLSVGKSKNKNIDHRGKETCG